jgi:hypothetical protein
LRRAPGAEVVVRLRVAAGRVGVSRAGREILGTRSLRRRDRFAIFRTLCTNAFNCRRWLLVANPLGSTGVSSFGSDRLGASGEFLSRNPHVARKWKEIRRPAGAHLPGKPARNCCERAEFLSTWALGPVRNSIWVQPHGPPLSRALSREGSTGAQPRNLELRAGAPAQVAGSPAVMPKLRAANAARKVSEVARTGYWSKRRSGGMIGKRIIGVSVFPLAAGVTFVQ